MNREKYIMDNLKGKYNYLLEKGYKVVALFLQGSQNYNLDIYDDDYKSDIDAKAIILPTLQDIILNKAPISTTLVLDNDEHIEVKDIRIMKDMFIKQNISYIELLYTNFKIVNEEYKEYIDQLLMMRDSIATINKNQFLRCIKGMSMEKVKAMEHPYPTLIDKINKYGYDPKQLHHIIRLCEFVERYLIQEESLKDCYLSSQKDFLIEVKKGKYDLEQARSMSIYYDSRTKKICDSFIEEIENINCEAIETLNELITKVIKHSFIKELKMEDEYEDY